MDGEPPRDASFAERCHVDPVWEVAGVGEYADAGRVLIPSGSGKAKRMINLRHLIQLLTPQQQQWYSHHYRYANSVVHRIALGTRIEASGEDLGNLQRLVAEFTGSIGSSLIDWFPALADKIPEVFQLWRPSWESIGQFHNDVYHKWWDPARDSIETGNAPPSWARDVLLNPESAYKGNDEEAMYCAMQLMEAGSDTTREALNIFIMAMIHNPDVFAKLRGEVDNVCDNNGILRCPTLEDADNLPYTAATVKEVLRWRPIFPLTPEHTLSKDLEFEGYQFPAGVGFVINGHAVANDCDDPHSFKPSRWLDGNEMNVAHGLWQFGGGRRICVGYRLAQRSLILNIARLTQCFDFATVSSFPPLLHVANVGRC
jgi:cytochrome P450